MSAFKELFGERKVLIGMVHLGPLPGSARYGSDLKGVIRRAVTDARLLEESGFHAVMVENFFDAPFAVGSVPPVTVSAMTAAALAVRGAVTIPVGVNVLRNDVSAAVSIAHVCGAQFVRCNVYVGALVTDQGIIEGGAREATILRANLRSTVQIWADVAVKHARPLGELDAASEARDAVSRGLADAVIVSGRATGESADPVRLRDVREAVPTSPLLIGSGFSTDSAASLLRLADGAIVGTSVKADGKVEAPVDASRAQALVAAISR